MGTSRDVDTDSVAPWSRDLSMLFTARYLSQGNLELDRHVANWTGNCLCDHNDDKQPFDAITPGAYRCNLWRGLARPTQSVEEFLFWHCCICCCNGKRKFASSGRTRVFHSLIIEPS